jgi:hypothetical protein
MRNVLVWTLGVGSLLVSTASAQNPAGQRPSHPTPGTQGKETGQVQKPGSLSTNQTQQPQVEQGEAPASKPLPSNVFRREIWNGSLRTVSYFGKGLSAQVQESLQQRAAAENQAAYTSWMQNRQGMKLAEGTAQQTPAGLGGSRQGLGTTNQQEQQPGQQQPGQGGAAQKGGTPDNGQGQPTKETLPAPAEQPSATPDQQSGSQQPSNQSPVKKRTGPGKKR